MRIILTAILIALTLPAMPAVRYQESFMNLPASTSAFETRFDINGDNRSDVVAIFQRRILIFLQTSRNTFPAAPDVEIGAGKPIPETYAAIAVGKVSSVPGLQLLLIGPNGVDFLSSNQLSGNAAEPVEPKPLLRKNFDLTSGPNLVFLDAALDVDGDGKTELVLPNGDLLEIYHADAEMNFSSSSRISLPMNTMQETRLRVEPAVLGSLAFSESGPQNMVQVQPRLDRWYGIQFAVETYSDPFLAVDFNSDKRLDLVTPRQIFFQNEEGAFTARPSTVYRRIATARAAHKNRLVDAPNLVDFNADGILDTFQVANTTTKLPRTDVSVFLGRENRSFSDEPNFVLRTRDFAYSEVIPLGDLNGDGCVDIALLHLDFQPSSMNSQLKSYLRSGLDGDLRFYLWDKAANRFPEAFAFKQRVLVSYDIYGPRQLFQQQIVMSSDMDGDKFPDLVMKTGAQEISVFKNLEGKGFSNEPVALIKTPTRFSSITVTDMNGDGLGDVLISGYREDEEDRVIYSFYLSM